MPTSPTPALFQSTMGEVYDALNAGNISTARLELVKAEAVLNGLLVDETTSEGTTDKLKKNLEGMRKAIDAYVSQSSLGRFERVNRLIP